MLLHAHRKFWITLILLVCIPIQGYAVLSLSTCSEQVFQSAHELNHAQNVQDNESNTLANISCDDCSACHAHQFLDCTLISSLQINTLINTEPPPLLITHYTVLHDPHYRPPQLTHS